jgi:hypothetical protein
MGLKVRNDGAVSRTLLRTGDRTSNAALEALRQGGDQIEALARKMVPVDEVNLEKAIHAKEPTERGINGRIMIEIGVDESMSIPGREGTVGQYATRMHESVYNLGPNSKEKQSGSGVVVGRKYLERAAVELEPKIRKAVEKAAKRAV